MALTSVVTSYKVGMSGDIIPNNFDMIPYSTFHTALLPHPNPLGPGNPSNISTGLMLTAQQPNGQNPYCPPITLTNGYYTNVNYPHNAESFCYVQPNDANSILNAYHTYPTSINLPLQATHISCDKLYTSNNHISNNNNHNHNHITAQNPLLSTINTNHITMNNNNYNDKNELGKRLEMIGVEKSNSLLDESSQGIIDKSTILSSLSSTSTSTTTTINTHGENENIQQNTSLLVLRLLMSGKEVGSIIGKRGENVRKYREESGARINISDGSSPERIVTITGTTEQIYIAFTLMSRKFEDDFTQGLLRMGDETANCPPVTLRLLVPVAQCGSIIGKGGSKIKDVRELTGASIQVASEALPTSTERTVTISGTADSISKCIRLLCDIFLECPNKGPVILYRPKPVIGNPGLICPATTFSSGLLHSNLSGLPLSVCENSHESGYTTPILTSASLLSNEVNSVSPTLNRTYANQFGIPSGILSGGTGVSGSCSVGCGVNNTSIIPNLPTANTMQSPLTVIGSGRPVNQMSDLISDQVHLFATLNQLDLANFQSYFSSILAPLPNTNPLATGMHSIGQPLNIPEIALTPGILGCYPTPTAAALPIVGSPNNYMFSSPAALLKISNRLPEDQFTTSSSNSLGDIVVNQSDMCINNNSNNASPNNLSICNNSLPIDSNNNYTSLSTPIDPIKSIRGLQNTASLLGLPSLSINTILNPQQQNSLFSLANTEESIIVREMIISNDVIGCIIGRGGTTINEIRNASKAQIKISNCEDGAKERKITVSGKLDSVNLAQFLINSSIAIHREMWAFNVRLASAATALMTKNSLIINSSSKHSENDNNKIYLSPLKNTFGHIDYSLFQSNIPINTTNTSHVNSSSILLVKENLSPDLHEQTMDCFQPIYEDDNQLSLKFKSSHRLTRRSRIIPY